MTTLFRMEAMQAHGRDNLNPIILSTGTTIDRLILAVILLVVLILVAAFIVQFPRIVTANGTLKSNQGSVKMYLNQAVIVEQVLTTNDSIVAEGDPLAVVHLIPEQSRANQAQQDDLALQLSQLQSQRELDKSNVQQLREQIELQIQSIKYEQQNILTSIKLQENMVQHKRQHLQNIEHLSSNGNLPYSQVRNARERLLENELILNNYQRNLQQSKLRLSQLNQQSHMTEADYRNRSQQAIDRRNHLQLQLEQLRAELRYTIYAQTSGLVTNLQISEGVSWQTRQPVLQLLPLNNDLHAELVVPSRHRGFIEKDMKVRLRFDAYPYQQYGIGEGVISEIAKASLDSSESKTLSQSPEPMYQIKVRLDKQFIESGSERLILFEGMKTTVQIYLESRSLFDWLIEPLKGMRV